MSRALLCCLFTAALLGGFWSGPKAHAQVVSRDDVPAVQGSELPPAGKMREPSVISLWTHAPEHTDEFNALRAAVDAFNRQQRAYKVEIFPSIYRMYEERVQNAAATGTLPCLLEVDGPFVHPFVWAGYLQPLDRFVTRELVDDLLPSIIAQGTHERRLYTLGQYDSGLGLWGNRRYLRQAAVRVPTIEEPWKLAEFEQALARLTALDQVEYALNLSVYDAWGEFYSYAYAPILQGFGGDLIERKMFRSAKGTLDGPESVRAMTHFQNWFKQGWTRAVFDHTDDFEKGKAALSWSGHWKYQPYLKGLGEELVLMPLPDFGQGIKTGMGSWSWGITSKCRDPRGAWQFLAWLMSPDEITRMTGTNGAVPARRSVLKRSSRYGPGGPLSVFAQQLETGRCVPRPATRNYGVIRKAFSEAVRAIIAGREVQAELSRAAGVIDQAIESPGIAPPD